MRQPSSRHRFTAFACAAALPVLWSTAAAAPPPAGVKPGIGAPWKRLGALEVSPTATTVFRWDTETFGVFDPATRTISKLGFSAGRVTKLDSASLRLDAAFGRPGGTIFPDPLARDSRGNIYWLSQAAGEVGVFQPDGKLMRRVHVIAPEPFSMQVLDDGEIRIFGSRPDAPTAGTERFTSQGVFMGRSEAWLRPRTRGSNDYTDVFLLDVAGRTVEIAARFPYARIHGHGGETVVDLLSHCLAVLPASVVTDFRKQLEMRGLPEPLGAGFQGLEPPPVFALGAAHGDDGSVFVLLNGSHIMSFDSFGKRVSCDRVEPEEAFFVSTSIAATGPLVAILSRSTSERARVEIWRMNGR